MTPGSTVTLDENQPVHLVGIGGAGMSALASILLQRGFTVTGSDLRGGREASALQAMGAVVHVGHDADHLGDPGVVVVSTAVPTDNPEALAARERGIPVIRRAELLAALLSGARGILVAGTHGKTTTTSMLTVALQAAGVDPSFAIGGTIHESGSSAHHGSDDVFVAEADESDRSFLVFEPDCAIVTNVELDHHDVYADFDDVLATFTEFLAARRGGGPAIVCIDDAGGRQLAEGLDGQVVTYGQAPDATLVISDVVLGVDESTATLLRDGEALCDLHLRVPGIHNLLNATAALAAALWAGASAAAAAEGLARFGGAQRRFQRLGTADGVTVVDDYAHHPTELSVTIEAARQTSPQGRIVAVFQPHRFSRTAALGEELGAALAAADVAVVTDVYPAGEAPVPGVTGGLVADAATAAGGDARYADRAQDLAQFVAQIVQDGDLVLTLGAGDITLLGPVLLDLLRGRGGAP